MKFKLILVILIISIEIKSQVITPDYLMNLKPTLVNKYERVLQKPYVKIMMDFAEDSILNRKVLNSALGKTILQVDLVYSDYKEIKSFDQPELNKSRYINLQKAARSLFENSAIRWNAFSQTGCNSPSSCSGYFHGFYIYFENPPTPGSMRIELKSIYSLLEEKVKERTVEIEEKNKQGKREIKEKK